MIPSGRCINPEGYYASAAFYPHVTDSFGRLMQYSGLQRNRPGRSEWRRTSISWS